MEEQKLLERQAYFFNEINKLSEIPIEQEPDLGSIDISKARIQMAYRDIKDTNFKGGIVDYLCLLSTEMFIKEWLNDCQKSLKVQGKANAEQALGYCLDNKIKNVLRLLFKNPKYFFENDFYLEIKKLDKIEDKKVFQILMDYRFELYKKSMS